MAHLKPLWKPGGYFKILVANGHRESRVLLLDLDVSQMTFYAPNVSYPSP